MWLLVGLGNPGPKYALNRHNVGFMAVDVVARDYALSPFRNKFGGALADGALGAEKVMALKPLTYMNDSGRAVAEAARFYKLGPERIAVFHDEVDLRPGKVRAKLGGGAAGHNGLRSLDAHLGPDYWRVRIGVGRPPGGGDVTGYVLRDFSKSDREWLGPCLAAVSDALPLLLDGDAPGFMTRVAHLAPPPDDDEGARPAAGAPGAGGPAGRGDGV